MKLFRNGRIFTQEGEDFASCLLVSGEEIAHVGDENAGVVDEAKKQGAEVIDLEGRVVLPGFIDSHIHILFFGLSLQKLNLYEYRSLEDIRNAISQYAKANPSLPRILCRGWHQPSTGGEAKATSLDDLDPRPIFVEAMDLHSTWCNTAALNELPIEEAKAECGKDVSCDADGNPTGLLAESAQIAYIWPHLVKSCSSEEKQAALKEGIQAYADAGYTGIIDMAMDEPAWDAITTLRKKETLPIHIGAHWFIPYADDRKVLMDSVEEAITLHRQWHPAKSPDFAILGVKLICDGVVDGCTAALSHPYGGMDHVVEPMWPAEAMNEVVKRVVEAGMQVAIHAIGDAAITQAIDAIASANSPNGRHRIEHLEITKEEDVKRLGSLGITASIQPVHSDPDMVKGYQHIINPEDWKRAFAYREFADAGAPLAIGTDAPTARHLPLPNLYNACTRKSATDPSIQERTQPHNALTLHQSTIGATAGAAYSRFAETWVGSLKKGLRADFVIVDAQWTPETLLEAKVYQTWAKGKKTSS